MECSMKRLLIAAVLAAVLLESHDGKPHAHTTFGVAHRHNHSRTRSFQHMEN